MTRRPMGHSSVPCIQQTLGRPLQRRNRSAKITCIVVAVMLAIGFARQPGLSRQYFAARPDQCNFSDQLPDEQVAKRIEVLRDQDKSAGSTDHVVSIVLFEPTRRIRVLRAPRKPG